MAGRSSSREWTEYWVLSDQYALLLAAEAGALRASASVTLLDAAGSRSGGKKWSAPGGRLSLADGGAAGVSIRGGGCALTVECRGGVRRVFGRAEGCGGEDALLFDLRLTCPSGMAHHAQDRPGLRFVCVLEAEGRAEMGGREYLFAPAHSFCVAAASLGSPERGRTVAAGRIGGALAGAVIGEAPENSVLLTGGKAWPLGGAEAADALAFETLAEQREKTRGVFRSGRGEILAFGRVSGVIRLGNGREIALRRLSGMARRGVGSWK